ncbi:hypothetical protein B0T21DRAFT_358419, partial [Apiosordaria backusii]
CECAMQHRNQIPACTAACIGDSSICQISPLNSRSFYPSLCSKTRTSNLPHPASATIPISKHPKVAPWHHPRTSANQLARSL